MDVTVVAAAGIRALAVARRNLGIREVPPGSNRTPFGEWFGENGVPWCAIFVSYCFAEGAGVILGRGHRGAWAKGMSSVPLLEAWLRDTGHWLGPGELPRAGDIVVFNWDGGVPDHVGIVERRLADGRVRTIEGNTAFGNDSDGGQVMRRLRPMSMVEGCGRIV